MNDALKRIERISKIIEPLNRIEAFTERTVKAVNRINQHLEEYTRVMDKLHLQECVRVFPRDGFYLSTSVIEELNNDNFIAQTAEHWGNSEIKGSFINVLTNYLYKRQGQIKEGILTVSPERSRLITEIFNLFSEKRYIPMIPLALSQIDGICMDQLSIGFFASKFDENKKKSEQKIKLKLYDCSVSQLLFNQVDYDNKNELILIKGKNQELSELNRHDIIHGSSLDYGSKLNAIKTILLLDFICNMVESTVEMS